LEHSDKRGPRSLIGTTPAAPTNQFFTGFIDEVRFFTFATNAFSTNDLLLNQPPNYYLGTTNLVVPSIAGSNGVSFGVYVPNFSWTASANVSWLHLATVSGITNTNILFGIDANTGVTRTGVISVGALSLTVTDYSLESALLMSSRDLNSKKIARVSQALAGRSSCKLG